MNQKHNLRRHPIYSIWRNIKTRLFNPKTHNFNNYGGKGITMCNEWMSDVSLFYKWSLENGYSAGLTLDRIDPSKGYCPENCRWTTREVQARNKGRYRKSICGFSGVSRQFWNGANHYLAHAYVNRKRIYLGHFSTAEEAAKQRDKYIVDNNLQGYILNFSA